jgi:hypothetical protein
MNSLCISLEDELNRIASAIDGGALLTFFNHRTLRWEDFTGGNQQLYHNELRSLASGLRRGLIQEVKYDGVIDIKGRQLHVLLIRFPEPFQCYQWPIIKREGRLSEAEWTPYIFKGQMVCQNALRFITRGNVTIERNEDGL